MKIIAFTILSILGYSYASSQVVFDSEKFANTKKMQKSLTSVESEPMIKYGVTKLIICECYGDFNISDAFSTKDFGNSSAVKKYILPEMNKYVKTPDTGNDYYTLLSDFVYERIVKVFTDNGLEVFPKEKLLDHPYYSKHQFSVTNTGNFTGISGDMMPGNWIIKPASNLPKLPNFDFAQKEPEVPGDLAWIADDIKAQGIIRISYKIEIKEDGTLQLKEFKVKLDSWLSGYKKSNDMVFKWKAPDITLFNLNKEIQGTLNYNSASSTEVNKELAEMISSIAEMFSYSLASGL